MINLDQNLKTTIREEALKYTPNEAGGLIVEDSNKKIIIINCSNSSPEPSIHFLISDEDLEAAKQKGKIIGYWHSHDDYDELSQADIVIAEKLGIDSIVYCVKTGNFHNYTPVGFEFPYVGRKRFFGVLDCLTLVMDYYKRELNIEIPYISHPIFKEKKLSWINTIAPDDFLLIGKEFLQKNGFNEISPKSIKKHDLIVLQVQDFRFPTHFGIYLGNNRFLHQLDDISDISIYGNYWKKRSKLIYRHSQLH